LGKKFEREAGLVAQAFQPVNAPAPKIN